MTDYWKKIAGMRDVIGHVYDSFDHHAPGAFEYFAEEAHCGDHQKLHGGILDIMPLKAPAPSFFIASWQRVVHDRLGVPGRLHHDARTDRGEAKRIATATETTPVFLCRRSCKHYSLHTVKL
ncbi:MAG: hypothetical protein IKQ60_10070 [Candidatus Methanomethylophilaceae archaeon]|nr:hypothetical protein [Candidatus Methanomethylophilaceae archaeon]